MLRTASSLPYRAFDAGLRRGRLPPTPPACYRASWQLPGPDFHRQATTSLRTARSAARSQRHLPLCWAHERAGLTGIDLLAWTQHLLLDGDLAAAEPKKLRYRLLHVAARLPRRRRTRLRIARPVPGPSTSSPRSTGSPRYPDPSREPATRAPTSSHRRNPTTASGNRHTSPTSIPRRDQLQFERMIKYLAKDRGCGTSAPTPATCCPQRRTRARTRSAPYR